MVYLIVAKNDPITSFPHLRDLVVNCSVTAFHPQKVQRPRRIGRIVVSCVLSKVIKIKMKSVT